MLRSKSYGRIGNSSSRSSAKSTQYFKLCTLYSKILISEIDFAVSGNSLVCYCIDTLKQNSSKIAT